MVVSLKNAIAKYIGTFKIGCLVRDCCTYMYTASTQFGGFLMVANTDHQTTKFNFLGHQIFQLYSIMYTIHLYKYISCSCPTNEEIEERKEKQSQEGNGEDIRYVYEVSSRCRGEISDARR